MEALGVVLVILFIAGPLVTRGTRWLLREVLDNRFHVHYCPDCGCFRRCFRKSCRKLARVFCSKCEKNSEKEI